MWSMRRVVTSSSDSFVPSGPIPRSRTNGSPIRIETRPPIRQILAVARPEPVRAGHADRQDRGPAAQGEEGDAVLGLLEGPGRAPGALGEGPQHAAVLQDRAGQPEGLRVGGAASDPERAVLAHEPAGQGPLERLRLRHPVHRAPQGGSQPARDERRVPVADVVGREDQRPARRDVLEPPHRDAGRAAKEGARRRAGSPG